MKELREVFFRGRKREVADKDIHAIFLLVGCSRWLCSREGA